MINTGGGGLGTFWNTLCGGGVVGGVVSDPQNGKNSSTQGTFWRDKKCAFNHSHLPYTFIILMHNNRLLLPHERR